MECQSTDKLLNYVSVNSIKWPSVSKSQDVIRLWPAPRRPGNIIPQHTFVIPRMPFGHGSGETISRRLYLKPPGSSVDPNVINLLTMPSPFKGFQDLQPKPIATVTRSNMIMDPDPKRRRLARANLRNAVVGSSASAQIM